MVCFQQKLLVKVGVTKTQTSKTWTSDSEKLTPPGCLENTDPQFNIFEISKLLGTFNF